MGARSFFRRTDFLFVVISRGYCSRRLRRLRKTLNFKMGNRHKFTGKKVTEEILSDNRYWLWGEMSVQFPRESFFSPLKVTYLHISNMLK